MMRGSRHGSYLAVVLATIMQFSCIESFSVGRRTTTAVGGQQTRLTTRRSSSSLRMVFTQGETSPSFKERLESLPLPQVAILAAAAAATALSTNDWNSLQDFSQLTNDPIAQSLVAAAVGVTTVSAATALVDQVLLRTMDMPVYDSKSDRFDQGTFLGRYCKMLFMCDPRLLLYSQEEVRDYQEIAYTTPPPLERTALNYDDRTLWDAKRIADSALNKETNEWIPRPFRMAGYLPFNGPICIALVGATSTMPLLFWSWLNQSQNALVNFYNRNASTKVTNETLLTSYAIAVGSALAVAFALSQYVQTQFHGDEALLRMVSFPSAVVASSLNCYFVRSPELESGVPLLNDDLEDISAGTATSLVASKVGVYSTAASRAILQMPTFFIPPVLLSTPLCQDFLTTHHALPVTTYLLLVVFGIGLPAAVGIFPQMSKLDAADVEPAFRNLIDPQTNAPYTHFTFNKGL